ncbi:MAG: hypothetical protein ABI856_13425 [Nitrospira sp.]
MLRPFLPLVIAIKHWDRGAMRKKGKSSRQKKDCVVRAHLVPARELYKYSVDNDPHSEKDIADYVHGQAPDETVQHIEKIKEEVVLGGKYEIWEVIIYKDR